MLIFGHVGITLGAVELVSSIAKRTVKNPGLVEADVLSNSTIDDNKTKDPTAASPSWLNILANPKDWPFLVIGSLLPDIIDKPVGLILFRDTFQNGRIFSHTILFLAIVSIISFFIYRRYGITGGIALSLGTLMHLVLDQMWLTPDTLLWPALGWSFEKTVTGNWVGDIFSALFHNPSVYVPEIIGIMIIIYLLSRHYIFSRKPTA
jgi:inner membrane protein